MKKFPFTSLNMILRPLRLLPLKRTTVFVVLAIMLQNVNSKPQSPGVFENVVSQSIAVAGNMAEMVGNAGMMSKNMDFEMPFVKAKSESKAGTGAALRGDDDSSDDSSEEDRRKRSIDFQAIKENALIGEEFLLPLPLSPQYHLHRDKRSPCHTYGDGTGGGTGGGGAPADDGDLDIERRLRAYARKRKAAAKKAKSKKTSTGSRKKKLISDEGDGNNQALVRRKRQTEVDDLNQTMQQQGNDFAQYAQKFAEKISSTLNSFMESMNNMAQQIKQHFSGQNSTNTMEI